MLDKIKEGLKQVLNDIDERFDEKNFVNEPVKEFDPCLDDYEEELDFDPYDNHSWRGAPWYCIRCGTKLVKINKDDKYWGSLWKTMQKEGTIYFLCGNEKCCHHTAPLVLHHPIQGYDAPAGDSYSISWVK